MYHTCVYRTAKLFKKVMTLNPSKRTMECIMKDPWLNIGQEEELWLYRESPWGDMDPQVTKIMKNLGFEWNEIQESVTERKYNKVMGTYLILSTTKTKLKGHTIRLRPTCFPDPTPQSFPNL